MGESGTGVVTTPSDAGRVTQGHGTPGHYTCGGGGVLTNHHHVALPSDFEYKVFVQQPPCVTFRPVAVPLRGPGRSPVLPSACCVGSLRSVGRCGRCSCWCRFRICGAQWLVCWGCAGCGGMCRLPPSPNRTPRTPQTGLQRSPLPHHPLEGGGMGMGTQTVAGSGAHRPDFPTSSAVPGAFGPNVRPQRRPNC